MVDVYIFLMYLIDFNQALPIDTVNYIKPIWNRIATNLNIRICNDCINKGLIWISIWTLGHDARNISMMPLNFSGYCIMTACPPPSICTSQAPGILPAINIEFSGTVMTSSVSTKIIVGWVILFRRLHVPCQPVIAFIWRSSVPTGDISVLLGNPWIRFGLSIRHWIGNNNGRNFSSLIVVFSVWFEYAFRTSLFGGILPFPPHIDA